MGTPGRVLAEIKLEVELLSGLLLELLAAGRVVAAVGEAATLLLELLLWWLLEVLVEGGHDRCGGVRCAFFLFLALDECGGARCSSRVV